MLLMSCNMGKIWRGCSLYEKFKDQKRERNKVRDTYGWLNIKRRIL